MLKFCKHEKYKKKMQSTLVDLLLLLNWNSGFAYSNVIKSGAKKSAY